MTFSITLLLVLFQFCIIIISASATSTTRTITLQRRQQQQQQQQRSLLLPFKQQRNLLTPVIVVDDNTNDSNNNELTQERVSVKSADKSNSKVGSSSQRDDLTLVQQCIDHMTINDLNDDGLLSYSEATPVFHDMISDTIRQNQLQNENNALSTIDGERSCLSGVTRIMDTIFIELACLCRTYDLNANSKKKKKKNNNPETRTRRLKLQQQENVSSNSNYDCCIPTAEYDTNVIIRPGYEQQYTIDSSSSSNINSNNVNIESYSTDLCLLLQQAIDTECYTDPSMTDGYYSTIDTVDTTNTNKQKKNNTNNVINLPPNTNKTIDTDKYISSEVSNNENDEKGAETDNNNDHSDRNNIEPSYGLDNQIYDYIQSGRNISNVEIMNEILHNQNISRNNNDDEYIEPQQLTRMEHHTKVYDSIQIPLFLLIVSIIVCLMGLLKCRLYRVRSKQLQKDKRRQEKIQTKKHRLQEQAASSTGSVVYTGSEAGETSSEIDGIGWLPTSTSQSSPTSTAALRSDSTRTIKVKNTYSNTGTGTTNTKYKLPPNDDDHNNNNNNNHEVIYNTTTYNNINNDDDDDDDDDNDTNNSKQQRVPFILS